MIIKIITLALSIFFSSELMANPCLKSAQAFSKDSTSWQGKYQKVDYKKLKRPRLILKSLLGTNADIYASKVSSESFDKFLGNQRNQKRFIKIAKRLGAETDAVVKSYFKFSETHLIALHSYLKKVSPQDIQSIKENLRLTDDELLSLLMQSYPIPINEIADNTQTVLRIAESFSITPELVIKGLVREGESFESLKKAIAVFDDVPDDIPFRQKLNRDAIASTKMTALLFSGTLSYTFIKAPKKIPKELWQLLSKQVPPKQKAEMLLNYFQKLPAQLTQDYFRVLMNNMVVERVADPKLYVAIFHSVFLDASFLFLSHMAKHGWHRINDLVVSNFNFAFLEIAMWMLEGSAQKKLVAQVAKEAAAPSASQLAPTKLAIKAMQDAIMSVPATLKETIQEAPLRFVSIAPLNLVGLAVSRFAIDGAQPIEDNLTKIAIDFLYTQLFLTFWSAPRLKGVYKTMSWSERHLLLKADNKSFKAMNFSLIAANIAVGAGTYVYARDWFYYLMGQGQALEPKNDEEEEEEETEVPLPSPNN